MGVVLQSCRGSTLSLEDNKWVCSPFPLVSAKSGDRVALTDCRADFSLVGACSSLGGALLLVPAFLVFFLIVEGRARPGVKPRGMMIAEK